MAQGPRGSRNLSEQVHPSPPSLTLSPALPSPGSVFPEGKLSLHPTPKPHSHHWALTMTESGVINAHVSHHEEHHPWEIKERV